MKRGRDASVEFNVSQLHMEAAGIGLLAREGTLRLITRVNDLGALRAVPYTHGTGGLVRVGVADGVAFDPNLLLQGFHDVAHAYPEDAVLCRVVGGAELELQVARTRRQYDDAVLDDGLARVPEAGDDKTAKLLRILHAGVLASGKVSVASAEVVDRAAVVKVSAERLYLDVMHSVEQRVHDVCGDIPIITVAAGELVTVRAEI